MGMWIKAVGIGPGNNLELTLRAEQVLREAEVILGYRRYLEHIAAFLEGKRVFSFAMGEEVLRCRETLRLAREGRKVALVSGGDSGIYGMAGLLLEVALQEGLIEAVEVIPGVSAMNAAAARLGAPLGDDFAVVSLSDYLKPWEDIVALLEALARADVVLVLYNPGSALRPHTFPEAVAILRRHRPPETPVGLVRNASLPDEAMVLTTLQGAERYPVDMRTVVVVGNRRTFAAASRLITPRGYRL